MSTKWWKDSIGYQIYIRSFKDSNNDGIGDIKGITNKLDYLHFLGINLIWICPFYKSPMDDNGYDVSDFFSVSEDYGTLEDVKELLNEAHKRGIKVIIDLILNQTSDEHWWFKEAKKSKNNPYHDYYIWKDPRYINVDGKRIRKEPTNWASFFGGSCWEYVEEVDQYYMKIFSKKMPDLNYENSRVIDEFVKIIDFWCSFGVDGFRLDAIAHLAKSEFRDSLIEADGEYKPDWSKFSNLDKVHTYLKELNRRVFSKYDLLLVGEVGGNATVKDALLYTLPSRRELNMVFNFDHNWCNNKWEKAPDEKMRIKVLDLKKIFNKWETGLQGARSWNALYWLNHDQPRVASHYADMQYFEKSTKVLALVLYFMWGTPFIYNGEEIGMTNPTFKSIDDFKDVSVKNCYQIEVVENKKDSKKFIEDVSYSTRDNARTIMQWDDTENGGFSICKPWNIICDNYKEINVEREMYDKKSLLNFYRKIIKIRLESEYKNIIRDGIYEQIASEDENLYIYIRKLKIQSKKNNTLIVIGNLTDKVVDFKIDSILTNIDLNNTKIVLSNYNRRAIPEQLKEYEGIVLATRL